MFAHGILGVAALALIIGTPAHAQTPHFSADPDSPDGTPIDRAVLPAYPVIGEIAWDRSAVERSMHALQCSRYFGCLPRKLRPPVASAPDTSLFE
jgi:hypothetical protein